MQFWINFWMLIAGKIVHCIASAIVLPACAVYLSETLPEEKISTHGFAVNLGVTTGLSIPLILGAFVSKDDPDSASWLLVQFIPVVGSIANLFIWLFVFKTEPLGFCI